MNIVYCQDPQVVLDAIGGHTTTLRLVATDLIPPDEAWFFNGSEGLRKLPIELLAKLRNRKVFRRLERESRRLFEELKAVANAYSDPGAWSPDWIDPVEMFFIKARWRHEHD